MTPSDAMDAGIEESVAAGRGDLLPGAGQAPGRFALLIPVTSRGCGPGVAQGVRRLLASLRETGFDGSAQRWRFELLFGVDSGDPHLDPQSAVRLDLCGLVDEVIGPGRVSARVLTFTHPPGHVCAIWRDLARAAHEGGCDYSLLVGDDVVLLRKTWADVVHDEFLEIRKRTGLPFGFGCVALADDSFPAFATYPVLHRTHMEIFGGEIFPEAFINQDADPFLFQIYRAFDAAVLSDRARLVNRIGGQHVARYAKQPVFAWNGEPLSEARRRAGAWLKERGVLAAPSITLDVIVPTRRVPQEMLCSVLELEVPDGVTTQFTIVSDRPDDPMAEAVMASIARAHRDDPFVRLRTNTANLGPGPTRNRGLRESAADWVLFLDDDVVPHPRILAAYTDAVRTHPHATGFIGFSRFPVPQNARQAGVIMAGVAFFWGIAAAFRSETELPWGVTANLCVRRVSEVAFDEMGRFPKNGGGEDIDYCLRLRDWTRTNLRGSQGFVSVPDAVIEHPWWDGGVPRYSHFSGWARGDGHLIDLYPELTYRNWPNLAETILGLSVLALALTFGATTASAFVVETTFAWAGYTVAACAACVIADLLVDAYVQLWERPAPECSGLSISVRLGGIVQGLLIRTASELGRIQGHVNRGNLLGSVTRRFNWFGTMWPGAVAEERKQARRRAIARLAALLASVAVLAVL